VLAAALLLLLLLLLLLMLMMRCPLAFIERLALRHRCFPLLLLLLFIVGHDA
jgi:hypothetical protein